MATADDHAAEQSAGAHALFSRIVVCVDDDQAGAAIALAEALATPDASFVLAHVRTPARLSGVLPVDEPSEESMQPAAQALLDAKHRLGHQCEVILEEALTVVLGLHRVAEHEQADLLVVGAHQPGTKRAHALPGLLHDAPCAVAITAPHAPAAPLRLNTVGLAFRATEPGRHAAELSRRIADARGAELHGMTVIPVTPNLWIGPAAGGVQTLARIDGSLEDFARSDLRGLGGVIDHIAEGEPVHELRRFSETVDLLVVGTRSLGPLRRLLTGSTADELSTTAQCPLLVVGCSNDTAA